MKNIQMRDPQHLKGKYQAGLKRLPELEEGSEEFLALCAGLKRAEFRFIRPILVDEHELVIDDHSRNLLRAALRWQLKEVPVLVCGSGDAALLRIHSLAHVRHLSKSAVAYLAVPDLEPAVQASRMKRLENLRKGQCSPIVSGGDDRDQTTEDLAGELGIKRNLLFEARAVHKAFEDKKKYCFNIAGGAKDGATEELTLKEFFEPKLLRSFTGGEHEQYRPMGLGGIIAGITAVRAGDRDKFNPKSQGQLNLFENKVNVVDGWKYWTRLSESERKQHFQNFEDRLELLPEEQRDELGDYFERLAKKCRKAAAD
jgi:hypothetical protein